MLRIKADAPDCVGQPGFKFGCTLASGKQLLDTAKALGLNVIGIRYKHQLSIIHNYLLSCINMLHIELALESV